MMHPKNINRGMPAEFRAKIETRTDFGMNYYTLSQVASALDRAAKELVIAKDLCPDDDALATVGARLLFAQIASKLQGIRSCARVAWAAAQAAKDAP